MAKGDKFSLSQCPRNDFEVKEMQKIPYASAVRSLMYSQVCTHPDIVYIVRMLGRYLSNPGTDHWKSSQTGHEVLVENKALFTRIQVIKSVGDHWIF